MEITKQNGDLEVNGDLEIKLDDRLQVEGSVKASGKILCDRTLIAGWGIEAGYEIKAGEGIKAGCGIKAGWGIEAGLSITAKWLDIGLRIFAGLCLWREPKVEETQINVEEIKQGEICFGKLNIIAPKEEIKKMTIEEISQALGYKVEIAE